MQSLCSEETDTAAEEDAEGSGEIYDPPLYLGLAQKEEVTMSIAAVAMGASTFFL